MTIRMLASVAGYALGSIVSLSPVAEATYVAAAQAQYYTFPANPNAGGNPPSRRILAMGGIPTIIANSGTITSGGAITLGTALQLTYPQCWLYLPAGAVVGGLAGWYYAIMSSTTVGVVYTNYQATMTQPLALGAAATLTAAVGSGSAYTGVTSEVQMAAAVIPAGLLGATGAVIAEGNWSHNSSAGAKVAKVAFGGSTVLSVSDTTTLGIDIRKKIQNRAAASQVIRVAVDTGAAQSVAPTLLSIDTAAEVTVALTGSIATATDTMVLENFLIEVLLPSANG
jgi:hypothetical protein